MNQEELKMAREQYQTLNKMNDSLKLKYKKLQVLMLSKEELTKETFKKIGNKTNNSYKIYIFMGSYGYSKKNNQYTISPLKNAPWTSYNIYKDLETEKEYKISGERVTNFENNYTVITPRMTKYFSTKEDYIDKFYELQLEYYKHLINIKNTPNGALRKIKTLAIMPPNK